ncbi:MAG: hypothetical protein LBO03_04075 [Acidaminococcales bacterium]|jgi:hypothetical protein|nr:hypothetical protein [Acidaminococcales bacterium]
MKKKALFAAICAFACSLFFHGLSFAGENPFTVVNKTDSDLFELYILPAQSLGQGPNALEKEALFIGKSLRLSFANYDRSAASWDVYGVNCCGQVYKWQALNLGKSGVITLYEAGRATLD